MNHKTYKKDITFYEFLVQLTKSKKTRNDLIHDITSSGFENCYLEFPVFSKSTYNDKVEFTVIESIPFPAADWTHFEDKLKSTSESQSVVSFCNLSQDTYLVIPVPNGNTDAYSNHLMNFLTKGYEQQKHDLIETFAKQALLMAENNQKIYISTHGHGVPWLHIRLSLNPKHYCHEDYINEGSNLKKCIVVIACIVLVFVGFVLIG